MNKEKRHQISFRISSLENLSIYEMFKGLHMNKKEKFKISFSRTIENKLINIMKKEIIEDSEDFVLKSVEKTLDYQNRELVNRIFARSDVHTIEVVKWLHSFDVKLNFIINLLSEGQTIDLEGVAKDFIKDTPWAIKLKKRIADHYKVEENRISKTRRFEAINNSFIKNNKEDKKEEINSFELDRKLEGKNKSEK
ncbi:hypothetical protein [Spiroplasma endosymbiont of Panorpa germanica]|uniref:hypothetical protein n=1 Tax=Spiroplasma endosymbiont of Panorpa germanica TaxID=3066314 RepID=UPI0030CB4353